MNRELTAFRCELHGHRYEAVNERAPCPTCNGPSPYAGTELDQLLTEEDPPADWLIRDLLEVGDRVIVTGVEGQGKTTLLRQVAVQAACGIHPFGGDDYDPLSVLVIDLENSRRQTRRKLAPIRAAAGDRYDINNGGEARFKFRPDGLDLADAAQAAWLSSVVADMEPSLLIIGPLYKMLRGDPRNEDVAYVAARTLDAIRDNHDLAVIIEAHSPYADGSRSKRPIRPYGASLWSRWPEFGIYLAPDGVVEHWRGPRDEREWPSRLRRGEPWPWMPDDSAAPTSGPWDGPQACMDAVLDLVAANPTVSYTQRTLVSVMRTIHPFRDKTIREAAERLAMAGKITVRTGARNARVYTAMPSEDF